VGGEEAERDPRLEGFLEMIQMDEPCGVSPPNVDADFDIVHDSQLSGYVDISEQEHGALNGLSDSLFGGRMHLPSDYTERRFGRKSHHIREIGIQRYERATILNGEPEDLFVAGAREANFPNRDRVVFSILSSRACCGERFSSRRSFTGSGG
jgi:hypothetical protein